MTPAADDRPVILTVPTVGDTAPSGAVLGGWIMMQIDHAAGRAGRLFAGDCVIRAIHDLTFHAPLRAGESLAIHARVVKTGRTSFRLELAGVAETGTTIVDAALTMICVDLQGQPRPLSAEIAIP